MRSIKYTYTKYIYIKYTILSHYGLSINTKPIITHNYSLLKKEDNNYS